MTSDKTGVEQVPCFVSLKALLVEFLIIYTFTHLHIYTLYMHKKARTYLADLFVMQ